MDTARTCVGSTATTPVTPAGSVSRLNSLLMTTVKTAGTPVRNLPRFSTRNDRVSGRWTRTRSIRRVEYFSIRKSASARR